VQRKSFYFILRREEHPFRSAAWNSIGFVGKVNRLMHGQVSKVRFFTSCDRPPVSKSGEVRHEALNQTPSQMKLIIFERRGSEAGETILPESLFSNLVIATAVANGGIT